MGTRGFTGVAIDGEVKISYQQFDSYPSGVGLAVLEYLRTVTDIDAVKKLARELQLVKDSDEPSDEDREKYAELADPRVSTGQDWYSLLRNNQGDLGAILKTGIATDAGDFPLDSLFCEYGYLVDLDAGMFEVYRGFQKDVPVGGRWAGRPTAAEDAENHKAHVKWCAENDRDPWLPEVSEYKAVELWRAWSLTDLPNDEEFLALEKEEQEV